jgi:NADH-quinone oxidoreductase subunit J
MWVLAAVNWHTFFFWLFALLAGGFAVGVLLTSNVVRMAFYLVVALAATAALFMLAGAAFVGAMQIMIYVGGTLVLLVFGVMLTAQASFISMKASGAEWVMAAIVGGSLLYLLVSSGLSVRAWQSPDPRPVVARADVETATPLGMGLVGLRVDQLDEPDAVVRAGMSSYLLPFEIVGVHLLVVLIGAAYLARSRRKSRELPAAGMGG